MPDRRPRSGITRASARGRVASRTVIAAPLREVLSSRDFRRLFAVRLTGQFSDGLFQAALATFVLFSPERQASAAQIAVAFAVLYLPYSVIGPFVGVLLDRWRRRQVLLVGNLLRALVVIVVLGLTAGGRAGLDLGAAVLVALGINRFILAGLSAALPHTVPERDLVTANAVAPTTGTFTAAVGGVVGVALRAAIGGGDHGSLALLCLAALGFAGAGLLALRMPAGLLGPEGRLASDTVLGIVRELADGARNLWHKRAAWRAVTAVTMHRLVFGLMTVVVILMLRNTLNPSADPDAALAGLTVIIGAAALGALLGAAVTPACTRRWGSTAVGATVLILAAVTVPTAIGTATVPWMIVGGGVLGFAGQVLKVGADTAVQRQIADDHRGRVFALYDVAVNVGLVVGVAGAALVTPTGGESILVLVSAAVILLGTGIWLRFSRGATIHAAK